MEDQSERDKDTLKRETLPRGKSTADEALLQRSFREPEFLHTDSWRLFRILSELTHGFDTLAGLPPAVTIFGSARTKRDDPLFAQAESMAYRLGKSGYAIITGGGPGIMEAANKGAQESGAISVGLNIELPFEQSMNQYVTVPVSFRYFFVRKTMFVKYAEGFVIFPGGFGTLDELFEAITLIQTGKLYHFPVILFGRSYWTGLIDWMREQMEKEARIGPKDLDLMLVTDSIDDAVNCIVKARRAQAIEFGWDLGAIHPTERRT